jgi:hypothetical protein
MRAHFTACPNRLAPKGYPSSSGLIERNGKRKIPQLSAPRRALIRLCQRINYGSIEGLGVRDAEPILDPPPMVLVDVKLDADEVPGQRLTCRTLRYATRCAG